MSSVGGDSDTEATKPPGRARAELSLVAMSSRVVIADRDAARRAALLDELTQAMPASTTFLEASTVSEVLEHARGSRMVIVGGAVEELPASSLAGILTRRYPDLHVVDLQASQATDR
jgi:hypothetical protein